MKKVIIDKLSYRSWPFLARLRTQSSKKSSIKVCIWPQV